MIEYVTIVAQTATGMATLAVAIFLAAQLRLQRKDSQMATQTELTSGIVQWIGFMITDPVFTHIYLRAIEGDSSLNKEQIYKKKVFVEWNKRWRARQEQNKMPVKSALILMEKTNPAVIPRNHNVEMVLVSAHEGNLDPLHNLLRIIKNPYNRGPHLQEYQSPPNPSERVYQTFCGT